MRVAAHSSCIATSLVCVCVCVRALLREIVKLNGFSRVLGPRLARPRFIGQEFETSGYLDSGSETWVILPHKRKRFSKCQLFEHTSDAN